MPKIAKDDTGGAGITRRGFLLGGAATLGLAAAHPALAQSRDAEGDAAPSGGKLITSAPVLMNPAERSIDVAFAVSDDANGWVEISKSPDMQKCVRVHSGGDNPLMSIQSGFASIRIKGLRSAQRYYYRIGADRIHFDNNYKISHEGTDAGEKVYSFTTLGSGAGGAFCVINDTHSREPAVARVLRKIGEIKPAAIIWNGDARNFYRTSADAVGTFLKPHPDFPEYAVSSPVLFVNGNHDYRGRFARRLHELVQFRDAGERSPAFAGLGRNFVQRIGEIALIGLDTGEDKQDTNPIMCGTARMTRYRQLQTRWLAEEIEKPAIKSARFKVAFCHIPLYEHNPRENPGDVLPADDDPRYKHPWAAWQRTCARMWGPLLEKAGVQLVVTGHQHVFRYDPPQDGRSWGHLRGGGPDFDPAKPGRGFPTVIEGREENGMLRVIVHDCAGDRVVFDTNFQPT